MNDLPATDAGGFDHWSASPCSAYVHVPFCAHRCGYCNFTLIAGRDELIERYLEALQIELRRQAGLHSVQTLFFGGGTPTHLTAVQLDRLFTMVREVFPLEPAGEWSVEANPIDIEPDRIAVLRQHGVNRVSLGVQSFSTRKLRLLERDHDREVVQQAVELLRPAIRSLSLDLIFGTTDETQAEWEADLQAALSLRPDHLSTYGLTFERGTQFWSRLQRGELAQADEELERTMYVQAIEQLQAAGLHQYEVSNFAQSGHRCRHNEVYWDGGSYFAVGPGAARYVGGVRSVNHRSTTTWIKRLLAGEDPTAEQEQLGAEDRARELLVLHLRRRAGVDSSEFARRTGFRLEQLAAKHLQNFLDWKLVEQAAGRWRLTHAGLLVSDSLWPYLLRR